MNEQQIKAQERMMAMIDGTFDSERKKSPTYAERQQRKTELMDEANKAMETGDLETVKKHHKAGRYAKSFKGQDGSFGVAAKNGHIQIVDFYVNGGSKETRIQEMMLSAAAGGQPKVIDYLIEQGADKLSICNALYQASWNNQPTTVEHLLSKGAIAGYGNDECLRIAASDGSTEVAKILLQHGANIHANGDRALKLAVSRKHDDLVKTLIVDFKMPIKDETKQWLSENNGTYALELLEKRELHERLEQRFNEPRPHRFPTATKSQKMKI